MGVPLGYQLSTFHRLRELLMMLRVTTLFRDVSRPSPEKMTPEPLPSITFRVIST